MPDAISLKSEGPQDAPGRDSDGSTPPGVVVEPSQPSRHPLPRRVRTRLTPEETTDALRRLKAPAHPEDCERVVAHQERDGEWGLLAALRRWVEAGDAFRDTSPIDEQLWMTACEAELDLMNLARSVLGVGEAPE